MSGIVAEGGIHLTRGSRAAQIDAGCPLSQDLACAPPRN
jgi:hypothetical protein